MHGQSIGPPVGSAVFYSVTYRDDHAFDESSDERRYQDCVARSPGAAAFSDGWSFPPGRLVRFEGSGEAQAAFEADLKALPGVVVQGPWPDRGADGPPDPDC